MGQLGLSVLWGSVMGRARLIVLWGNVLFIRLYICFCQFEEEKPIAGNSCDVCANNEPIAGNSCDVSANMSGNSCDVMQTMSQ